LLISTDSNVLGDNQPLIQVAVLSSTAMREDPSPIRKAGTAKAVHSCSHKGMFMMNTPFVDACQTKYRHFTSQVDYLTKIGPSKMSGHKDFLQRAFKHFLGIRKELHNKISIKLLALIKFSGVLR
jgi:hypothetical protein